MRQAIFALVLTGCVTQGHYDELKDQHDMLADQLASEQASSRAALADRDRKLSEGQAQLRTLQSALADEKARTGSLSTQSESLSSRVKSLESDLAGLVKDRSRLSASVDDMKVALADLNKRKAEADARLADYRGLLSRFQHMIDAGKLKVKIDHGRMVLVLATDVLFPSGSAQLSKDGKGAVLEVAKVLSEMPDRSFQVEGHTDDVPIATSQYPSNWELASARAINVVRAMVEAGMRSDRISGASFGQNQPAQANETPEGRAANRRIEIVVVPDLSSLPGFQELQKAAEGT